MPQPGLSALEAHIRNADLIAEARRADGRAGRVTVRPEWGLVAAQVRDEISGGWDDAGAVARFGSRGGTLLKARGRLRGPRHVAVGDREVAARRGVIISTGSRPAIPAIDGLADADHWTTHDVIASATLPDSLVVLGGAAVGCELGQLLARYGVRVTIVEAAGRLLPGEEPEASAAVTTALEADGIAVRVGATVESVEARDGETARKLGDGSSVMASRLLVASGRLIDLGELGRESVGLDGGASSIATDEHMPAAEGTWAIGDVTGRTMLTHVALYQSTIAAADILDRPHPPARYDARPRVTFTDPELGAVGMTEARAAAAGLETVVAVKELGATFRGWLHDARGLVKLVVDRSDGRLLGATAVGPAAGEVLGLLELAVHARIRLSELRNVVYAFPALHGAVGEAIGAYGRGVITVLDPWYDALARLDSIGP